MDEADSATALEVLERDYQDTVKELAGPRAQVVEPFKAEYEKLYKALLCSHESEKRLTKKIRDLNAEISASAQSVQTAMKTAAEDQQQIATLRRDIEAQQKMVEQSLDKERTAKQTIEKHRAEIVDLQRRIDQGAGMNAEQEMQLGQLSAQREQLEKDRDMLKQNTEMLARISSARFDEVQKVEQQRAHSEEQIADIKQVVEAKRLEVEAEKRRKEELEQRMKDLRVENETRQEELTIFQRTLQSEEADLHKVEQDLAQAEKDEENLEKRVRSKMEEQRKLQEKLEQEGERNKRYAEDNKQREAQAKAKKEEIAQHAAEKDKILKMHEALKKKLRAVDDERQELESQRNTQKQDIKSMQEKSDSDKRDIDIDRKKIEDLLRERDILNKSVVKADERTKRQIDLVKRQETQAMNMQKDIARWKADAVEFRKRIAELEKQREKYGIELSQANAKFYSAKEELKIRGSTLTELKKQIQNVDAKLSQQKTLYDAVCMDRNLHAKNHEESKEQIAEMRRKFNIMFHQTNKLKGEIREKDNRVVRGTFKQKELTHLNKKLDDSKEKAQKRVRNLMIIVETHHTQMKKLASTIQVAEQERQAQQKELEGVIGERDILGAQLIRRNKELALLYEKIKIQQSTLQKGESQYQERLQEVSQLRAEIRKAKADVAIAKTQVTNVEGLKREIHHLTKTLLREETKAKALQEELENPMNVHRWRELEGSDPATYEMIQKVKSLQKLLIAKTEEVVEKDAQIQEKEKLYVQLKSIIARQPGPEVAEQLAWYSQNLKEKSAHMKQMASELEMYHDQVQDLRDDIDRHSKDFQEVKQAYFQRLRQQRNQE
uniref:Cilia- and flagella-associated protein 58 central coiled coil domain-containing protein n=1 Tax=Zooxanthella nutricula TaxID=1333877 RepID=A0A6U6V2W9_9DINO|mmetsp:Transcript_87247/g.267019  ORF Transcript_87247/g.267019 Transcript_87247/m.267019 type:complete len:834 (+) Transcript_87247:117-2618(+)